MSTSQSPDISQQQGVTVIALGPEYENLDDHVLEDLKNIIIDVSSNAEPPLVVVDLSHTRFFGSAFIEILFRAWNRVNSRDGKFCICGLHPYCAEVIQVTHLDEIWAIYDDRDKAVAALSAA